MTDAGSGLTRRRFLQGLGRLGGAGAVYAFLTTAGLLPVRAGTAGASDIRDLTPGSLAGVKVIVLGAGLAGLCAAFRLSGAGAEVVVLEAEARLGGRSLTLRQGDRFKETGWRRPLEARFVGPAEAVAPLYFNAGPGRIPAHHDYVLHYCRRLGVEMQSYIFASRANLLQDDRVFGGKPVPLRRVKHDLRGYVSELLAKVTDQHGLDALVSADDRAAFFEMLQSFGALSRSDAGLIYRGSSRLGYDTLPGAGLRAGDSPPALPFDEILKSGFWDSGLFNDMVINWQSSLLQPAGGMDRLWRALATAEARPGVPTDTLVRRHAPVVSIDIEDDRVRVGYRDLDAGAQASVNGDYCISTLAPPMLSLVDGNLLDRRARSGLRQVLYTPACKIAWQGKTRFWEERDRIFGGISWTSHPIGQIWYPSDDFLGDTGILVGAYAYDRDGVRLGGLSHPQRLDLALEGGERLHPGFADLVHRERGLSIAWQHMPFQPGGWAADTHAAAPGLYGWLNDAQPFGGRVYLAGDFLSQLPGWQEGRGAHRPHGQRPDRPPGRRTRLTQR